MRLPTTRKKSRTPLAGSKDLYRDERISVTPSWLTVDNFRYPIRTVVSMESSSLSPKLGKAYFFFFGYLMLIAYSLYQFTKPTLPEIVPWVMLLASVAIFLFAATVAFRSRTNHQIIVTLIDGVKVPVVTQSAKQAQGVLDGLTAAMDWHLRSDVIFDAKRSSHIRKAHASSNKAAKAEIEQTTAKPEADTVSPKAAPPLVSPVQKMGDPRQLPHPSRVERRKLAPMLLALLKGRE